MQITILADVKKATDDFLYDLQLNSGYTSENGAGFTEPLKLIKSKIDDFINTLDINDPSVVISVYTSVKDFKQENIFDNLLDDKNTYGYLNALIQLFELQFKNVVDLQLLKNRT